METHKPYTHYAATKPAADEAEVERLLDALQSVERGIVVAGRLASREQGEAITKLADALGWPLLPDVGSQVRLGAAGTTAFYDALLASEEFRKAHAPEAVLHVGGRALSKRLEKFVLDSHPQPYIVVRENPFRLDPGHRVTHSVEANVVDLCDTLTRAIPERPQPSDWLAGWHEASEVAGRGLTRLLPEDGALSEPLVARAISRYVPERHGLVVANSMPVRDLDTYAAADGAPVLVASNRGASGIDGTVATTAGFARGLDAPVTLLIGDLALLHDLNSLAMLRGLAVTVVVINNDGGGIFSFLPIAEHEDFFEPFFGTPQRVGFEPAATMFGLGYAHPRTATQFVEAYRSAIGCGSATIIEVNTNREENVALHGRLLREVGVEIHQP